MASRHDGLNRRATLIVARCNYALVSIIHSARFRLSSFDFRFLLGTEYGVRQLDGDFL